MNDVTGGQDIILTNRASLLDYLFLNMAYQPVFTKIVRNPKTKKLVLQEVSGWKLLKQAFGIEFP